MPVCIRLFLSHVTNEFGKIYLAATLLILPRPTAPRRKLIAAGVHDSHGNGHILSLSLFSLFLFNA